MRHAKYDNGEITRLQGLRLWIIALFWRLVGRVAGIVKSKDRHALCQAKAATENWNLEICRIM